MTETDDKISFDSPKEEQSPAAATESSPSSETEPDVQPEPSPKSTEPVHKTLMGMGGFKLPAPETLESALTPDAENTSNTATKLPGSLRLPVLRDKIANAERNAGSKKSKKNKKSKNKTATPPLQPIAQVGYDDSFASSPPFESAPERDDAPEDSSSENPDVLPIQPIVIEESLVEISVTPLEDAEDNLTEIPVAPLGEDENLTAQPIVIGQSLEEIPVIPIEEKLEDNPALPSSSPENATEEKAPRIINTTPDLQDDDDYEDEATQIGAGLFDLPGSFGVQADDAFDDEHTQISEGLSFEEDRKAPEISSDDLEGDRTEIASLEEVFADAHRAPAVAASAAAAAASTPARAAEADDDFDGEKTELFDSPFENDPICPKLTVLSGPALGMEFFVNKMRNTIGRGTNNTIIVPDASMSRQHFEINQSLDESFVLRDLQAVNGTFLNGTRIVEADLFHGDRIEAGKTVIQFLIGSNAPQVSRNRRIIPATTTTNTHLQANGVQATFSGVPVHQAPAATRDPGKLATYVALGCAILCIPLVLLVLYVTPTAPGQKSTAGSSRAERAAIGGQTASQTYLAGVEAVKKREWSRAQELFLQTVELEPNFDGIPAQLTRIEQELAASKLLEAAQADIEQGNNASALPKVQKISHNSVYYDDAQRLVRQLRQQEVFSIFDQARANFDQGELERASALLTELLEIVPEHREGLELKSRIEEAEKEAQRREEAALRAQQAAAEKPSSAPRLNTIDWASSAPTKNTRTNKKSAPTSTTAQPNSGAPVINFTEGFTFYRARDFNNAVRHFESIAAGGSSSAIGQRAERTVTNIRRFETSYKNGQAAFQKSNWAEAVRHFQEASRADIAVVGAQGYFSQELSEKLATSFGEMGMEAFNAKQYERAFTSLQRGNSYSSKDATLQRLSRELNAHANQLYEQANKIKGSQSREAAAHCRTIMTMTAPNSAVHQNAKKLLDTL